MNIYFQYRKEIQKKINSIPKKNRVKFQADLLKLIEIAHEEDYEDFEI